MQSVQLLSWTKLAFFLGFAFSRDSTFQWLFRNCNFGHWICIDWLNYWASCSSFIKMRSRSIFMLFFNFIWKETQIWQIYGFWKVNQMVHWIKCHERTFFSSKISISRFASRSTRSISLTCLKSLRISSTKLE